MVGVAGAGDLGGALSRSCIMPSNDPPRTPNRDKVWSGGGWGGRTGFVVKFADGDVGD